jgi:hypothetical protein
VIVPGPIRVHYGRISCSRRISTKRSRPMPGRKGKPSGAWSGMPRTSAIFPAPTSLLAGMPYLS